MDFWIKLAKKLEEEAEEQKSLNKGKVLASMITHELQMEIYKEAKTGSKEKLELERDEHGMVWDLLNAFDSEEVSNKLTHPFRQKVKNKLVDIFNL